MSFQINQQLCLKCKHCIDVCPVNMIAVNEQRKIHFIAGRTEICLGCGQCMAVCSSKAIVANNLSYEHDFDTVPKQTVHHDDFLNFLSTRRSVRNCTQQPVADALLNKILDALSYAPYGASPEKMEVTVVNNRQTIETALSTKTLGELRGIPYQSGTQFLLVKHLGNLFTVAHDNTAVSNNF